MSRFINLAACSWVFFGAVTSVSAQDLDEINQIIRGLAPIAGQTVSGEQTNPLTGQALSGVDLGRAIPEAAPKALFEVVVKNRIIAVDTSYALDFEVFFPFDSAELTQRARSELAALGQALTSPQLQPYAYLVAGHTDAKGSSQHNQGLSERRAAAVVHYLIKTFSIEPKRLVSVGFGQTHLKVPDQPNAAINRRVEVLLISGEIM